MPAAVQAKNDTLSAADKKAMALAYWNSTYGSFYFADSFSRAGDSINAGIALQKISPYYLWYEYELSPANIDSFLGAQYKLRAEDRETYKAVFNRAWNSHKPESFTRFKAYHDEDQDMRNLTNDCGTDINCSAASRAIRLSDSLHGNYLYEYVSKKGWPSFEDGGVYACVLAIHDHGRHGFYLHYIKQAVLDGKAPMSLYELVDHWKRSDFRLERFLNDLRTREYAKIDISEVTKFDSADLFKLMMPPASTLKLIAETTKELCPLDHYFMSEGSLDDDQKWWNKYQYKGKNAEIGQIQQLILDNSCYNEDKKRALRDAERNQHKLWYKSGIREEGPYKMYVYLVSARAKPPVERLKTASDTFRLYFETDKFILTPRQQIRLQHILVDSIGLCDNISISGYADNTGEEKRNTELSSQRAEEIRTYLTDTGIKPEAIRYCKGKGVANRNNGGKQVAEDRRVDIIVKY